MKNCLLAHLDV
ncbi:BnaA05g19220D [Brassica napus]|uniref:BnaA05g19220D protein n=1 Tax=Brassica napus TaxID=3708 RepID=A0A078GJJ8_BRANA|nr:BnaA05g19220D [Brassica napus]